MNTDSTKELVKTLIPQIQNKSISLPQAAKQLRANGMRCNCDLDNWEPTRETGHSHVCRIHKTVTTMESHPKDLL